MLYDPYTRKGSLESFRIFCRQCTTVMFPECDSYTAEEQMEAEEHMRLTPLDSYDTRNHNRNEMLRLIKITYQSRRDFLKNSSHVGAMVFLKKYPRLKDMTEAVRFSVLMDMRFSYYTFFFIFPFLDKRRILFTQERTYGNLPVKLAKGGKSINRVCQAEIDKKFGHFGNLKETGGSCRTVRLV